MSTEFGILGPLVATIDGHSVDLGSPKQRAVLALLLINANKVVSSERVFDELWGERAEGKENSLWVYVSRLRSTFEPNRAARGESSFLLTQGRGYMLKVEPTSIDAVQFEQEAAQARELLGEDPARASEILERALERWRGPALQDFAYEEFAQREIARLEELRVNAIGDRIEADLARGKAGELVGELEAFRKEHPLRERFVGQLMLALYRSGRQADALRTFERFRRHIGEEMGIEPSDQLRRLEEQVLLHDARIQPPTTAPGGGREKPPVKNPFKGLRPFGEDDASVFYGRERLVAGVLRRIADGAPLVAVVGPSGSGKSSVVRAGVIPAIRRGDLGGDSHWLIAQMVPGQHPFAELEVALLRTTLDGPDSLREQLTASETGILRAGLRVLPDPDTRLLLVVDQFEELFTHVAEELRNRFLNQLAPVLDDPHRRIVVVVTLRSDFYSRPLRYPEFGSRLDNAVINAVPLLPDELESAARRPTAQCGAAIESALVTQLVSDVADQSGALPLFQFALTELFDRRLGDTLTVSTYREMGGIEGVISTRAEDLFLGLDPTREAAAKQLFLRMVTISDGDDWAKRRVPASEIVSLDVDKVALQDVIDVYTQHRLLTLDRDHVTGSPTVEVAHEALLEEWSRLQGWIEDARDDISRHLALRSAIAEWADADRDPDYLLTGTRLAGYEQWAANASIELTLDERAYLEASVSARRHLEAIETERQAAEAQLATSARRRLWGLVASLVVIVLAGAAALWLILSPSSERPLVASVMPSLSAEQEGLASTGISRGELELGVVVEEFTGRFSDLESQYRQLAQAGTDLLFIDPANSGWPWVDAVIAEHPDTAFAVIDGILPPSGARTIYFADHQAGYVAGALAALTTQTRVVGFVGRLQFDIEERWRAGFEAGVAVIDPGIQVVATYTAPGGGFSNDARVRAAAGAVFERNADVVLGFAGDLTPAVVEEAQEVSIETGVHRWVIGSDSDWSLEIGEPLQPHLLTSAVKKWDVALFETIESYTEGEFTPGIVTVGLTQGAVALAPSRHISTDHRQRIDQLSADVAEGRRSVPSAPTGALLPPLDSQVAQTVTLTWDGLDCTSHLESESLEPGAVVRLDMVNATPEYRFFFITQSSGQLMLSTPVQPMAGNSGYLMMLSGATELNCGPNTRQNVELIRQGRRVGGTLVVG